MKTFHLFLSKPTFDPETEKPWQDPEHIDSPTAENSEAVAYTVDTPDEYDREDAFWILEDGKHPDEAEEWSIIEHAPVIEVRRMC